jgi:hypothetical protein
MGKDEKRESSAITSEVYRRIDCWLSFVDHSRSLIALLFPILMFPIILYKSIVDFVYPI